MIAKWRLKAIVQKTVSFLPAKEKLNYLMQRYLTGGVELNDQYFGWKIEHASDHIRYFKKYSKQNPNEQVVLELGTGWYPIVPIALYLAGYKGTYSVDIQNWMTADTIRMTIEKFREWKHRGKLSTHLPQVDEDRWNRLMALGGQQGQTKENLCATIGLSTLLQDARKLEFNDHSIDLICSNNTFEHIPESILKGILKEFGRVIKRDGVMSHFIDMSDHFAHFDSGITIYNFLKFSPEQWSRIDNSIQPQNRLRFKDYKSMYSELNIPVTEEEIRPGDLEALSQVKLDSSYANYSPEELAVSHGYLVSKMS